MKILMTGATGLVGQALKRRLERDGHQVVALGRKDLPPSAAQVSGAEGLIHLAGENIAAKRWSEARKKALRDSRVETAVMLREALESSKTKLLFAVSASGVGIYGDRGAEILTENSRPGDDFLSRLCVEWEAAADLLPAKRIVKFRLAVVMSSQGGYFTEVAPIFRKVGAGKMGNGSQWFSWVHLEDVVEAFALAVRDESVNGVCNLTAPNPVTNSELTSAMRDALGVWKGPPVPRFAMKLLYGELGEALFASQRCLPEKLLKLKLNFKYPKLTEALNEISPASPGKS